jgi:hypothetical protein
MDATSTANPSRKHFPMPATDLISQVSLSLLAENRADTKEQSALRSALSSASCQRSGRSPALPYPLHEQFQSTMLSHQPFQWGHLYFVKKGTFLLWLDRGDSIFALTGVGWTGPALGWRGDSSANPLPIRLPTSPVPSPQGLHALRQGFIPPSSPPPLALVGRNTHAPPMISCS